MAWWNEVLGLLHDEWRHLGESGRPTVDPAESLREAQKLLHRTTRELEEAQARAEAARRRLSRARQAIEELAGSPDGHPGYRDRLTDLARTLTRESELVATFDAHIEQLSKLRDRIGEQLRQLARDLSMMDAASGAAATVAQVGDRPRAAVRKGKPGFRGKRPDALLQTLEQLPQEQKKTRRKRAKGAKDEG